MSDFNRQSTSNRHPKSMDTKSTSHVTYSEKGLHGRGTAKSKWSEMMSKLPHTTDSANVIAMFRVRNEICLIRCFRANFASAGCLRGRQGARARAPAAGLCGGESGRGV